MLQAIRDKAQGWIAWAIVILISIPFALFGIQEYLGSSADPVIAEVGGAEIKESELERSMRDFRQSMRATLGEAYRQELFEGEGFRQQVLDRMIVERALRQSADDWNMRVSDAQVRAFIRSVPAFQNEGRFDQRMYDATVRNRGLSNAGFEDLIRQDLVMQQLQSGVRSSAFVTDAQVTEQTRLEDQQRAISFLKIPMAEFNDVTQVSEADAKAFYEQHQQEYRVPERVKLAYIELGPEELAPLVESDEEKLRSYYADHRDQFVVPEERQVRHILVGSEAGDEAAQKALAMSLREQLLAGADFADLAREHSSDPGSAANGGDLGWVNRGLMVKPFEESAFSLELDTLSEPVKTDFGYHLIEVTGKRGGGDATFEDMREEIEVAYRKFQAEDLYFTYFERLADAAYENSDSLEPAAEVLGLTVRKTGWINRGAALPAGIDSAKSANAAFSEDVLGRGHNSEVIELSAEKAVVLRVIEHEVETVRPFDQVREQVISAAASALASDKAAEKGQELIQQLRAGGSLQEVAETHGWKLSEEQISRDSRNVPAEVIDAAYAIMPPVTEGPAYDGVSTAGGDFMIIALTAVTDGEPAQPGEPARVAQQQRLLSQSGAADFEGVTQALRKEVGVVLSPQ